MKKEILNLGRALSKPELQSINGGATCIKACDNPSNQQLACGGPGHSDCQVTDYGCYSKDSSGRYIHEFCNTSLAVE